MVSLVVYVLDPVMKTAFQLIKCIDCLLFSVVIALLCRVGKCRTPHMMNQLDLKRFQKALNVWFLIGLLWLTKYRGTTQGREYNFEDFFNELWAVIKDICSTQACT
ncbi:hypothetical protein D3C77_575650 [compost metagenome]